MPQSLFSAKASYKKATGALQLTGSQLEWIQDGKQSPSVVVPNAELSSLFCSKEGSAQVKIKISLAGDDNGFMFIFTAPHHIALAERESIKNQLTTIISKNRSATANPLQNGTPVPPSSPHPIVAQDPKSTTLTSANGHPSPTPSRAPSRATSVAPESGSTSIVPGNDPAFDFQLRKRVLLANPELRHLHRELVISAQITEQEFWQGREHLLLAQAAQDTQRKGKAGQIVDPRPETVDGETKIRITPQLVRDIFEEYPVVQKAYSENVPSQVTEAEFWKRYFQSKLFNAHRASIRSAAAQHVVKDDPILDKYLEKDDDGLEPRRQVDISQVDLLVDLAATIEDHEETGNERDVTMQAGKQRGALPLIRKFNEHSERLLNSALGDLPPAKRRRTESTGEIYENEIALEDLVDQESTLGVALEMQDRQRYFEGRMTIEESSVMQTFDFQDAVVEADHSLQSWEQKLPLLKIERQQGDAALLSMTKNVASRLEAKSRKNDIPDALFQQMVSCQTAANEFLRQFWTSLHPPPIDPGVVNVPTLAQRNAKAMKMIEYLSQTHQKVEALVQAASQHKTDPQKVRTALQPLLDSVERSLSYHRTRTKA